MSASEERYLQQILVPEWGAGRQALLAAREVLIVGCGGLGCAVSSLLARSGVGALKLADGDVVSWSNIHRQVLFDEADARAGTPKVEAAARALRAVRGDLQLVTLPRMLGKVELEGLVSTVDLVVDATDSFHTRFQINDACAAAGTPWIYGGVAGASGMAMAVVPGVGPCLRCLTPGPPDPQVAQAPGVLPPVVAIVGAIQASLAMQLLVGEPIPAGLLYQLDLWSCRLERVILAPDPECSCCRGAAPPPSTER